jgi:hypothetical protein
MLAHLGYDLGSSGIDGDFGRGTFIAVRKFQVDNSLLPTGVVTSEVATLLKEKAPNVEVPSDVSILSRTSRERIFERERDEAEVSEDVKNALEVIQNIVRSASFSAAQDKSGLSNVRFGKRVKYDGVQEDTKNLVGLMNAIGSKLNIDIHITSAFRTPHDQARIMYYNWNRRGGIGDGSRYLLSLYRRFKDIDRMARIFETQGWEDDYKISEAEKIVDTLWRPFKSHGGGRSLDISFRTGRYKVGVILTALKQEGIIRLLKEDDHWHITAKDVPSPAGAPTS